MRPRWRSKHEYHPMMEVVKAILRVIGTAITPVRKSHEAIGVAGTLVTALIFLGLLGSGVASWFAPEPLPQSSPRWPFAIAYPSSVLALLFFIAAVILQLRLQRMWDNLAYKLQLETPIVQWLIDSQGVRKGVRIGLRLRNLGARALRYQMKTALVLLDSKAVAPPLFQNNGGVIYPDSSTDFRFPSFEVGDESSSPKHGLVEYVMDYGYTEGKARRRITGALTLTFDKERFEYTWKGLSEESVAKDFTDDPPEWRPVPVTTSSTSTSPNPIPFSS